MEATEDRPAADYRAAELDGALRGHGCRLTILDSVPSTNEWLVEQLSRDAAHFAAEAPLRAVVAGFQSRGKGRLDRSWFTPAGTAVTFSVALTPRDRSGRAWPQDLLPWLTLMLAHSVTATVRELTGVPAAVKWPNDVLIRERKVCGILASLVPSPPGAAHQGPTVVLGAGINVQQGHLPVPGATSLRLETGNDAAVPTRSAVLTGVLAHFSRALDRASVDPAAQLGPGGELRRELESALDTLGRRVLVHLPGRNAPLPATAVGLGSSGQLRVRDDDGREHEYGAGDVVHVRPGPRTPEDAGHENERPR